MRKCNWQENAINCLYPTPYIILLFNIMNKESKELLHYSVFILIRRYKGVKIWQWKR